MTGAAVAAAVLALGAPHGPAGGHDTHDGGAPAAEVAQLFASFAPAAVDVVTGDTVRWHNESIRRHTVTADDGAFDSGPMSADEAYAQTFGADGPHPYYCRLHAGMSGTVRVHDVLLGVPRAPAAPRRPYPLDGRTSAPPGTAVTIEADSGGGFAAVARTAVGEDGSFDASVTPATTTTYRAVADGRTSPPVQLLVLDRRVEAAVRRRGRQLTVSVRVVPASPGQTVVLQLHLARRFGWWPVQRAKLDARSRATFTMRLRHAPPARVLVTLPDGATQLASSGPLRTR